MKRFLKDMDDADVILGELPKVCSFPTEEDKKVGITNGYDQPLNAFVALSKDETRLEIFIGNGEWLGISTRFVRGDIAAFSD